MKILHSNKKTVQKNSSRKSVVFQDLSKSDREKFLRKEASEFSKYFTDVIVKLANE